MASPNTKRNVDKTGDDLYSTPLEALEAAYMAGIFDKYNHYYDPCNGLGDISDFLKSKGKKVITNDIVDYGCQDSVMDFFDQKHIKGQSCIVMNPPFKLNEQFLDHALSLCDYVIMFNRTNMLEVPSRSEKHASKQWPLEYFYSFASRVSCTKGINREKTASATWYGWFVYNKNYSGEPKIRWLFTKNKDVA